MPPRLELKATQSHGEGEDAMATKEPEQTALESSGSPPPGDGPPAVGGPPPGTPGGGTMAPLMARRTYQCLRLSAIGVIFILAVSLFREYFAAGDCLNRSISAYYF